MVTLQWFRSSVDIDVYSAQQSYVPFEAINVSSQRSRILYAHFTQAYKTLDTLSPLLLLTLDEINLRK